MENNNSNRNHREFCNGLRPVQGNGYRRPPVEYINNVYNSRNRKRNIKTPRVQHNKKWIARGAAMALAIAALATPIGINKHKQHQYDTAPIQQQIELQAKENLKQSIDNYSFDGTNFKVSANTQYKELYNVLSNTDIDEVMDEYLKNPSEESKAIIKGRIDDLVNLNTDILKALVADGEKTSIDNVDMSLTVKGYDSNEQEKIIDGQKPHKGWVLRVNTPSNYLEGACGQASNFTEIPSDLFTLISHAKIAQLERNPDINLKLQDYYKTDIFDRAVKTYKDIKRITAKGYSLGVQDNRICLEKDGKYYDYETKKQIEDDRDR